MTTTIPVADVVQVGGGILSDTFEAVLIYTVAGEVFIDHYATTEGARRATEVLDTAANGEVQTLDDPVCVHGAVRGRCTHVGRTWVTDRYWVAGGIGYGRRAGWTPGTTHAIVCHHHPSAR